MGKRRFGALGVAAWFFCFALSARAGSDTVTLALFPAEAFVRNTGAPQAVTRTFSVPTTQGAFVLHVDNGSPTGDDLISSAVIQVDGVAVVRASDLNQRVTYLDIPLTNLNKGQNTLSVEVRSIPSSYVTVSILGIYSLDVRITSPVSEAAIESNRVDVEGTWAGYTNDVGITVNGVPAAIAGGTFAAAGVRLDSGINSLQAVITTREGISDSDAVSVTATGQEPALELRSSLSSGAAPLAVTFLPRIRGVAPVEYRYDFQGDGAVDLTATTDQGVTFTYEAPGTYRTALTAMLPDGTLLRATALVLAEERSAVDSVLSARWNVVSSALRAQSVEAALSDFLPESQEKYRRMFTSLSDRLPALYADLPAPELVKVQGNLAQYRIRRTQLWEGQPKVLTYYVWYARDAQGLWKVQAY